jgi:hypothetical protein
MRPLLVICLLIVFAAGMSELTRPAIMGSLATAAPVVSMGEVFRGY